MRRIRERRREQPFDELPEATSSEPGPDALAVRSELAALIAQAAGGLSERDRAVLELTYRHGLDGPELAEALGVSSAGARTLTHRLRETIERSLGALLVARRARTGRGCPDLEALLADWDGQFTILMRKRIARHIDSCPLCEEERRGLVNPVALLGGAPLFIPAPHWLRARTMSRIQLTCAETGMTGPGADRADIPAGSAVRGSMPADLGPVSALATAHPTEGTAADSDTDEIDGAAAKRRRRVLLPFVLLAAAVIAALGLTLAWPFPRDTPLTPAVVTGTGNQPSPTPSAAPTTQAPPSTPPPVSSTSSASPPPTYQRPAVIPVVPPAVGPSTPAESVPASPSVPKITARTTPPTTTPMKAVPQMPSPTPASPHHSNSSGSSGSSGSGSSGSSGSPGSGGSTGSGGHLT